MNCPKVSVVIPVYNAEKYLAESLDSILNQTYPNTEIICVDDGSTDSSVAMLQHYAAQHPKIRVVCQENRGAGAARNHGMRLATGEYLYFFDSDDITVNTLLEKAVARAQETQADMVVFHGYTFTGDNVENRTYKSGYSTNAVRDPGMVFSYRDFPDSILATVNVVPWNKLIRADFVRSNRIRFEEISTSNDSTFGAVCNACAQRIAVLNERLVYYRLGHAGTISSGKQKSVRNVLIAVGSIIDQVRALPHFDVIRQSLRQFVIHNYVHSFLSYTQDFASEQSEFFYRTIQETFRSDLFTGLDRATVPPKNRALFEAIRDIPYDRMLPCRTRELTVALTADPHRIGAVPKAVEQLRSQTRKPDRVLLYLQRQQFPGGEAALPEDLTELTRRGLLEVRWCDGPQPRPGILQAMQEYPHSLTVTLAPDAAFPNNLLQNLLHGYYAHPDCICAMQVHLTLTDPVSREILPCCPWTRDYRAEALTPSALLFAACDAGVLFPPQALHPLAFGSGLELPLGTVSEDILLNTMAVASGLRTACASEATRPSRLLPEALPGLQDDSRRCNEQYAKVRSWLKDTLGEDVLWTQLEKNAGDFGPRAAAELHRQLEELSAQLQQTQSRLSAAQAQAAELKQQLSAADKARSAGEKEIARLNREIRTQPAPRTGPAKLKHKLLRGIRCCRDHGIVYTLRRGFGKVIRFLKSKTRAS